MKKKQDDETKVYLVYDEELDQFVLKKGDDCTTGGIGSERSWNGETDQYTDKGFRAGICYRLNSIYKTDETVRRIFRSGGTSRIYLKSWT